MRREAREVLREEGRMLRVSRSGVYEEDERGISALVEALFDGADLTVGLWEVE
jgi:hypothetical protein